MQSVALASGDQVHIADDPPSPPAPPSPAVPGNATPQVAAIYTAEQLQEAVFAGVRDIEIRAHLDLRNLPRVDTPETPTGTSQFGYIASETRSIRVCFIVLY